MKTYIYPITIKSLEDQEGYYAECPVIQGAHTIGVTPEEAIDNLKDAVRAIIEFNFQKIKSLPAFEDDLKEKLKNPNFRKGFGLALKRWDLTHEIMLERKRAKMTQTEFAKELKTSQSFIARAENGGQNLTIDVLMKMADVLSVKQSKPIKFQIVGAV